MAGAEILHGIEHFESLLKQKADKLVDVLQQGDIPAALDQIQELYEFRHQMFYQEVGTLTRGLHEALKAFGKDVQHSIHPEGERLDLTDASASLDHVVGLTEKNAHQTLDRVDRALSILVEMEEEGLSDSALKNVVNLRFELTEIMVSQEYQDVAGQLIRKVMMLLSNVEMHLVQLMDMAATVERLGGASKVAQATLSDKEAKEKAIAAEGPQIRAKDSPDVVTEQDDVDELLSSLGF